MSRNDVKTLLMLSSSGENSSFPILFHCARYWAEQGSRVLFISKNPHRHLPMTLGSAGSTLNPDSFKLIQFMYLANSTELLQQLCSIHLRHSPVSVIIIKNLENYFKNESDIQNEDHVSLICASLLYAVSVCAKILSKPTFLISEYISSDSTIMKNVIGNFFHNVWELKKTINVIILSKLSPATSDEVVVYRFQENLTDAVLTFAEIVKKL